MPRIAWETDVEYYDLAESTHKVARPKKPSRDLDITRVRPDNRIAYEGVRSRQVTMRILGHTGSNPNVQVRIRNQAGAERIRRGELIGSFHPEEDEILPGVLRTGYHPAIRDLDHNRAVMPLPLPVAGLVVQRPRIIRP